MNADLASRPSLSLFVEGVANWQPPLRGPIPLGGAALTGLMGRLVQPAAPAARRAAPARAEEPSKRTREVFFEFTGRGSLSVTSSITGRHYRFGSAGARLPVDSRDWNQLSRVPDLKRL
ncbi:MAG: hypothetical protein EPO01_05430 [Aquabacterium sp.]|nr:MAG: hypothetical protein EPO01_05430 [Aquabacterium sp.]